MEKKSTVAESKLLDSSSGASTLRQYPYLQKIEKLWKSYPALWPVVDRLNNTKDYGRRLVSKQYEECHEYAGTPGRCAVLFFNETSVEHRVFCTAKELEEYLDVETPAHHRGQRRRLFVLEDLEPSFVDLLGDRLGVDPLVFSEQMNTWSSTDSRSVPFRALPSMHDPEKSFTLRYFEIRTLDNEKSIDKDKNQMTFAVNRRRIERWRDIDLPSVYRDRRHAVIRRCASFWTSNPNARQQASCDTETNGWDALLLVDPPMDSCPTCAEHNRCLHKWKKSPDQVNDEDEASHQCDPSCSDGRHCKPSCLILEDPRTYKTRNELWKAENWTKPERVRKARHNSVPYHCGGPSLVPPPMSSGTQATWEALTTSRNMQSPFDEMIFYWTQCLDQGLLRQVHHSSVNSAHYLLKFIAQHWAHQLELIGYHVYNSEWFADEHDANVYSLSPNWKKELQDIAYVTKDINYTLRQMSRFDHAITLDIERLGLQLGCESVNPHLPKALADAQRDFLAMSARLRPLRQRVDDISGIANDVANLRASLKGIQDGEHGLRLSLFAAVIFPLTLVAAMFSMSDGYRPGQRLFWVFWAASVPFALVIGGLLLFGELERWTSRLVQTHQAQEDIVQEKMKKSTKRRPTVHHIDRSETV